MDVVLGAGWPGVMLHEAVGHGLEGDFNRKKTSAFAGLMGQQVAAKGVTVVDDGTMQARRGSLSIDDEGTPTGRTVLIEDGILTGYMQDRQNARLMNMKPTGNGRRESHAHVPMPRMTNTYMLAGKHDPAEIIASVKNGLYAVSFGGGQVDITSGKYVFQCTEAYKIENGKVDRAGQGRHADRQRADRPASHRHDRQRLRARPRHRHLRQERPRRAGRRRPAVAAHGPHHRRRHGMTTEQSRMASRPERKAGPLRTIAEFAAIILVVLAAKTAIAEPFYVPSGSMEPTLLIGDELLATKFSYGYSTASLPVVPRLARSAGASSRALPKRGDVVVFRWPGDRTQVWVKRVIGLPGDRIALRGGQVFINGEPVKLVDERHRHGRRPTTARASPPSASSKRCRAACRIRSSSWRRSARSTIMPEITVPPGHVFVMGDNRDNSADSRVPVRDGGVGLLPVDNLVGRVDALVGSWDLAMQAAADLDLAVGPAHVALLHRR